MWQIVYILNFADLANRIYSRSEILFLVTEK